MLQPEIAVLRFGLGARPGDLAAAAPDPRAWLRAQTRGPAQRAGTTTLAPSNEIFEAVLAARKERREERLAAAAPEELQAAGALLRGRHRPGARRAPTRPRSVARLGSLDEQPGDGAREPPGRELRADALGQRRAAP